MIYLCKLVVRKIFRLKILYFKASSRSFDQEIPFYGTTRFFLPFTPKLTYAGVETLYLIIYS